MTCNKRNASIWKADFSNGGNWRLNIVAISPWNSRKTLPVIIKRNLTGWKGTLTFIKIFPVESRVCSTRVEKVSSMNDYGGGSFVTFVHKISKLDLRCIAEKITRLEIITPKYYYKS